MFARKGSYLIAIAADGHRAPSPAACARIVIKKQPALSVGTHPKTGAGSFGDKFGARAGYCGEQPVEASFARHEFDFPAAIAPDKFIMTLGDAQDLVYRVDPLTSNPVFAEHGRECLTQSR